MKIGIGQADITPVAGTHLAGSGAGEHRPARFVLEPLKARAVVFEQDGRRFCILALDVTIVTGEWTERIRRAAAARFGFSADAVMVHAIQTHSAPAMGYFMFDQDFPRLPLDIEYLRGGEAAYAEFAAGRAVEAIGAAVADLEPADLGCASAVRDDLAFNRRGIMRDGRCCMPWFYAGQQQPLGPVHIRYLEGPTDPEVGVFAARRRDLSIKGLILHHTCHPVNLFATQYYAVSPDWCGVWCERLEALVRAPGKALVLNGCCGNINPWPAFTPDFKPDHRRMGQALADSALAVLARMTYAEANVLGWRMKKVSIPLKPPDPERLARAQKMLAEFPEPKWLEETPRRIDPAWFQAASVMSVELMRKRAPALEYEILAARVGDTAFVGLPGEPFVEGQLRIKLGSPAAQTFVAHVCSEYVGYLPTAEAFAHGGHEVDFSYWAKLAPEALELIVRESVGMLRELF